jgi:hypothetical protein
VPAIVSVFRPVAARRLVSVRALGQIGDGMLQTALATFVLFSPQRQADPAKVAIAFAIMLLPYSVVGPFVGVLIDRWQRRDILIWANVVRIVAMVGIGLTIRSHATSSILIVLVLASLGVNRFLQAAMAASIPHVVEGEMLITANALIPTIGTACSTAGAGIGVLTQKVLSNSDSVNSGIALAASILAASAAATAWSMRPAGLLGPDGVTGRVREALGSVTTGLADGVRAFSKARTARMCLLAVALQRFAFGVLTVHILLLARTVWNATSSPDGAVTDFGLAAVSAAVGAAVAALLSAVLLGDGSSRDSARHALLARIAGIVALCGTPLVALGLGGEVRLHVIATAGLLSFVGQLLKISTDTAVQLGIADAHRGRAFSLYDMAINACIVTGITLYAMTPYVRLHTSVAGTLIITLMVGAGAASTAAARRSSA